MEQNISMDYLSEKNATSKDSDKFDNYNVILIE
jgi:hypothetical protein